MLCKKCLKEINDDSRYCQYCGFQQSARLPSAKPKQANGMGTAYKRGRTWTVKVTIGWKKAEDGHLIAISRTKGGFPTKHSALMYAPALRVTEKKETESLDQIWKKWRKRHESRVGESTMAGYLSAYNHYSSLHLMKVDKITANMLQTCIDKCERGKRTKQMMKVVANLLMKYAMDDNQISRNPAANLYVGEGTIKSRPPITEEELQLIHSHFESEEYAKYVYALCYLGFRPTEFLSLKKSDYHVDGGYHYLVGGEKTEAGIDRAVTIPPAIIEIIEERLSVDGTELLFPRHDRNRKGEYTGYSKMTEAYFREFIFKPMMARMGIEGRVPYSTRHTYANKIKRASGADRDKAALMGHADYETTKRHYQSTDLDDRKAITDQLE